jgi:hypothetical protein
MNPRGWLRRQLGVGRAMARKMRNPRAVTLAMVIDEAGGDRFATWLRDPKNWRAIPHRFEQCGYNAGKEAGGETRSLEDKRKTAGYLCAE